MPKGRGLETGRATQGRAGPDVAVPADFPKKSDRATV